MFNALPPAPCLQLTAISMTRACEWRDGCEVERHEETDLFLAACTVLRTAKPRKAMNFLQLKRTDGCVIPLLCKSGFFSCLA